jgi:hypothetical protein
MRKRFAANSGHEQSSEKAVTYESDVREYKLSDRGILTENDFVF